MTRSLRSDGSDLAGSLTFAIGEIHGRFDKLQHLLAACEIVRAGGDAPFVYVGDYIDRGPESKSVLDFLIEQQARQPSRVGCEHPIDAGASFVSLSLPSGDLISEVVWIG